MPLNTGSILEGRYRIDGLLGQGGMGAVYRGTDLRFNAQVAIKENRLGSEESQRQFAREAALLFRLRHSNLPRVSDHFVLPGQGQYLVMDYIEGQDLNQILARRGPVPEAQALSWIGQVLAALDYLHRTNIIHRDVKPANVKITPEGHAYLVDFGLAKEVDPLQETTIGARGVTPGYAPAEQYGSGRTDARSDLYSAGATLYALLTGRAPAEALDLVTRRARLVPACELNPAVSPQVEAALERSLQPAPDDRFQTAAEFRTALAGAVTPAAAGRAIEGRPAPGPAAATPHRSGPESATRVQAGHARRRVLPWLLAGGAVALLATLGVGIAILLGGDREALPTPAMIVALATLVPAPPPASPTSEPAPPTAAPPRSTPEPPTATPLLSSPTPLPGSAPLQPSPSALPPSATPLQPTVTPTPAPAVSLAGSWKGSLVEVLETPRAFDCLFVIRQGEGGTITGGAVQLGDTEGYDIVDGSVDAAGFRFRVPDTGDPTMFRHFWGTVEGNQLKGDVAWNCYDCTPWGTFVLYYAGQ